MAENQLRRRGQTPARSTATHGDYEIFEDAPETSSNSSIISRSGSGSSSSSNNSYRGSSSSLVTSVCPAWVVNTITHLRDYILALVTAFFQRRFGAWFATKPLQSPERQQQISAMLQQLSAITRIPVQNSRRHDKWLAESWSSIFPAVPFQRVSPQWGDLGFQGHDPQTDFRGSGELGLRVLHYFCTKRNHDALSVSTNATRIDYPFACALIQITFTILNMAKERPQTVGALLYAFRERARAAANSSSSPSSSSSSSSSSCSSSSSSSSLSSSASSSASSSSSASASTSASSSSFPESKSEDGLRDFLSGASGSEVAKDPSEGDEEDSEELRLFVGALGEMVGDVFVQFDEFYCAARPANVLAFNPLCNQFFDQTFKQGSPASWSARFGVAL